MSKLLSIMLVVTALLGGCTLSHVTSIQSNFEPGTSVSIKCKEYKKLVELTQGVREMEKYGWMPATLGYKHTYILWGFALKSRMWVCFEKPSAGDDAAGPTDAPPEEQPAESPSDPGEDPFVEQVD